MLRLRPKPKSLLSVTPKRNSVNIILFNAEEINSPFPRNDERVVHILNVLRRQTGDSTDVGLVNGPRGKATLTSVSEDVVDFSFQWLQEPPDLFPVDLIVGLSRPQTCRKILQEATSLGVGRIFFVNTDRGEDSYAKSKLWATDQWKRLVREGVQQAFTTRFPAIEFGISITDAIRSTETAERSICLDNYEATVGLLPAVKESTSVVVAVGSERGWTKRERAIFSDAQFTFAHLGQRPLRTETATIAAVGIINAALRRGEA